MASYGISDKIEFQVGGKIVSGMLVDIDMAKGRFKVKTKDGYYWVTQGQIDSKA